MFEPDLAILSEIGLAAPNAIIVADEVSQATLVFDNPDSWQRIQLDEGTKVGKLTPCEIKNDHIKLVTKINKLTPEQQRKNKFATRRLKRRFPQTIPMILTEEIEAPNTEATISPPNSIIKPTVTNMTEKERKTKLKSLIDLSHLTPEKQKEVYDWLMTRHNSFSLYETDLGNCDIQMHSIDTEEHKPISLPLRRLPFSMRAIVEKSIQDFLAAGIIRPSFSPWSFPIVPVKKKDNTLRLTIDYRELNKISKSDVFPLPRIDDLIDTVGRIKPTVFSTTDCAKGFHQQQMDPDSIEKTTFITHKGLYEYTRMPMGIKNGPSTFQRLMQQVLAGIDDDRVKVYLDDILVLAETHEKHKEVLEKVLRRLEEVNLKLNPKKCSWFQEKIIFLGFEISKNGVSTDPNKIKDLKDWQTPTDVSSLRKFLGFASYYRRYVHNFAKVASPLYRLLKNDVEWFWDNKSRLAFKTLRIRLMTAPVLRFPHFSKPFFVETDASKDAIAAILAQKDKKGKLYPIGYVSRTTLPYEKNYTVTELECLALVFGMKQFRCYLYSTPSYSNHGSRGTNTSCKCTNFATPITTLGSGYSRNKSLDSIQKRQKQCKRRCT